MTTSERVRFAVDCNRYPIQGGSLFVLPDKVYGESSPLIICRRWFS
jgi:hypothetical protein